MKGKRNQKNQQREANIRNNPNAHPICFNHPENINNNQKQNDQTQVNNINNYQNQNNINQGQINNNQNQSKNKQKQILNNSI